VAAASLLCVASGAAFAQEINPNEPNQSSAALHSAQTVNTPEKKQKWLREKYHLVMSQQWPTNFPVPPYTSNVVQTTFSNSTQGQPTAVASVTTRDTPLRVFEFYQTALGRSKWTIRMPSAKARADMNLGTDYYFLTADQGKQSIYLTCSFNPKNSVTVVNVNWKKNL
jgi:hypothetical protein